MPDLGEGLTEGEIINWLVAVGDVVTVDQPIAEMSTEKAVVEVPTPFAGRVVALHGAAGDVVTVGSPLISIEVGSDSETTSGNVLVGYGTSEETAPQRSRRPSAAPSAAPSSGSTTPASPLVRRLAAELG
ncbi:MAG TPA: biotin/lipoyl-containing protein, partial [Candidatus Dormibacteraeota bacterium]|nr:biotin/lipoyl-containing protein [Candidatus Dormibacteraeota bacterium]